jgi:hypothetical protein
MSQQTVRSDDLTIAELFKDFYVVPSYQREYVWTEENVQQLLEDVAHEFPESAATPGPEYFLGSIVVCAQEQHANVYELIDGQQRMTTCYLVLCAIRDRLFDLDPQKPMDALRGQISSTTTDAVTGEDVPRYRVELQYEDSKDVLKHIAAADGSERSDATLSLRNLWRAYDTIAEFLREQFNSNVGELRRFYAHFSGRVKLIRVRTASVSHALRVFETINDRGVGLDAMDLLKNLMFIHAKSDDFEKLKNVWKELVDTLHEAREKPLRFLRYYILADHDVDRLLEEDIYEWFKNNEPKCGYKAKPLAFVSRLKQAAQVYARLMRAHDPQDRPNRHLANIRFMSGAARQHFVVLLAARTWPQESFDELARQVENVFFTHVICREQAKELERLLANTASDLREVKTLDELKAVLEKRFAPEKKKLAGRFTNVFTGLAENDLQKYRLRYVLAKLAQHIDEQAWGSVPPHVDLDKYINAKVEVEHVLPRKPDAAALAAFDKPTAVGDYIHRLGNLVLLEKSINASVSNGAFETKKAAYSQSNFLLTKGVVAKPVVGKDTAVDRAVRLLEPFPTWTSDSIARRQEFLVRLAHEVWEVPHSGGLAGTATALATASATVDVPKSAGA